MTGPTPKTRAGMYRRDHDQCALCGRRDALTHGHRRAVGMGGSKIRPSIVDSITLCSDCNDRAERDLQIKALAYGVKVRKWVKDPAAVPVLYPFIWGWARLTEGGVAVPISADQAAEMMRAVYGDEWDSWMKEIRAYAPVKGGGRG
jgi:hypothetical protein